MKIAIDATILEYDGRGISKSTVALYKNMKRLHPDVELYLLQSSPLVCDFDVPHAKIMSPKYMTKEKAMERYFPKMVAKNKIDFVHFPFNGKNSDIFNKKHTKAKVVSTIHDIIPAVVPESFNLSPQDIQNYLSETQKRIDHSDIIHTISYATKNDLEKYLRIHSDIYVTYHSYYLMKQQNKNIIDCPYFLYNGGYCPRKGIDILVSNFLQLKLRGQSNAKLILTGLKGNLSEKTDWLINYGLSRGWIEEKGYVSDDELASLYQKAIALVYLSEYEGFGMPPLEAMHLGCPVITTYVSSIPEVCGSAAYYVDRNNDTEIQKALQDLEIDNKYRQSFISKGYTQAKKFSWEKNVEKLLKTLNERK